MEMNMVSRKLVLLTFAIMALTTPALAQGGGGGGAGGAGGGSSGAASGDAGTGGSAGVSNSQSGNNTEDNNNRTKTRTPATNTEQIVAGEKDAAVHGTKTAPTAGVSGGVSAPGVGVGHTANGLPIGSPGSGLGSPEQPVDGKIDSRK
jgi:hypothetical protein